MNEKLQQDVQVDIQNELQSNVNNSHFSSVGLVPAGTVQQELAETAQRNKPWTEYLSDLGGAVVDTSVEKAAYNMYELSSAGFDPTFNPKDHPELYDGLDPSEHSAMDAMGSPLMARRYKEQLDEQKDAAKILHSSGLTGAAVNFAAQFLDPVNLAFMIGAPETVPMRVVSGTSRAASMARGAIGGAVGNAGIQAVHTAVSPNGQWGTVIDAAIDGGVFGTALGATGLFRDPSLLHVQKNLDEWGSVVRENGAAEEAKATINPQTTWKAGRVQDTEGSIGAAYVPENGEVFNADGVSAETLKLRSKARAFIAENGLGVKYEDMFDKAVFGDKAKAAYDAWAKSPIADQFELMWNSGSMLAREDAYKLAEHAIGGLRNNTSGIMMKEVDHVRMLNGIAHETEGYAASLKQWMREKHPDMHPIRGMINQYNPAIVEQFNKEVLLARNAVHLGKAQRYEDISSEIVAKLNKRMDQDADQARILLQEAKVNGSEHLTAEHSRGYFGQHLSPDKVNKALQTGRVKYNAVIKTLSKSYASVYGGSLSPEAIDVLAKAQVRRAKSFAEGIDMNMYRLLSDNGELYMRKYLTDSLEIPASQADKIISGLKSVKPDSEKAGFLRSTKVFDWSTPIEGSDLQLIDLMNTDIPAIANHYANKASGMTALARVGYQYGDIEARINSIKEEILASGVKSNLDDDALRNFYQPFIGGPIYGAPPPPVRRALSAVALSLYNGMGIAQATETAAGMVAFGMKDYLSAIQTELKGADKATVRQVQHLVAGVRGEERLYMEQYQYSSFMHDAPAVQELNSMIDRALAAGRSAQGVISGFFAIRKIQQSATIRCTLHALADTFDGLQKINPARLEDLGADAATSAKLSKYFSGDSKVVTRYTDEHGVGGLDLHLEKWAPDDVMALGTLLNRSVNQTVQKAMLGEKIPFMGSIVGSIMMQGKGFTVLSITKQAIRTYRLGSEDTSMALIYGLALGTAGYVASRVLAADGEGLDPISIVKGGISNSNMTSWMPMFWDTPMAMLGLNSMKLSNYSYNPRTDILGVPPALTTLNSMIHLPVVPLHLVTGTASSSDRAALKAMPLVGNHPFFKALWNQVGDTEPKQD